MSLGRFLAAAALAAVALGCSEKHREASIEKARTGTKASAPVGEGMCKEHGVLQAVCTKCNPALATIFKSKGDWCAEHEFPESFCPVCHPERGGKPVVDVAVSDGAPLDGAKIRFKKKETAKLTGIETVKAIVRPGGSGLPVLARIVPDATKVAQINARSSGVVQALKVDVGATVKKGDPLVVIDSPEVGADRARLQGARARLDVAEQNYQRELELEKEGIVAKKSLLAARQDLDMAKGEYSALAASLSVLGAGGGGVGGYTLKAPIAGVITERSATIGKLVSPEQVLYEIVDTSSVWAEMEVPESEITKVAIGQNVTMTLDAITGREWKGKVGYVAPSVDPHTRTVKARLGLPNPDGALRAQMFGQARIEVEPDRPAVMVPRGAIQRAKGVQLAFVRIAEDQFETRRVEVGLDEGELVEVKKGLKPGEDVVTTGSFLLKTETLKESIGAGCCEAD